MMNMLHGSFRGILSLLSDKLAIVKRDVSLGSRNKEQIGEITTLSAEYLELFQEMQTLVNNDDRVEVGTWGEDDGITSSLRKENSGLVEATLDLEKALESEIFKDRTHINCKLTIASDVFFLFLLLACFFSTWYYISSASHSKAEVIIIKIAITAIVLLCLLVIRVFCTVFIFDDLRKVDIREELVNLKSQISNLSRRIHTPRWLINNLPSIDNSSPYDICLEIYQEDQVRLLKVGATTMRPRECSEAFSAKLVAILTQEKWSWNKNRKAGSTSPWRIYMGEVPGSKTFLKSPFAKNYLGENPEELRQILGRFSLVQVSFRGINERIFFCVSKDPIALEALGVQVSETYDPEFLSELLRAHKESTSSSQSSDNEKGLMHHAN